MEDVEIEGRTTAEVYQDYQQWCEIEGFKYPLTRRQFTTTLQSNGFDVKRKMQDGYKHPQRTFTKM